MTVITKLEQLPALPRSLQDAETALLQLLQDRSAFSPNTWRNMVSTLRLWSNFATSRGYQWFPASPEHVREWLDWMDKEGKAASTIKNRVTFLNVFYRHLKMESPAADFIVKRRVRKITREAVMGGEEQGQAIPFRRADLDELAALWRDSPRLQLVRDLAFMGVAYNTMLRLAEVCRIRTRDVTFNEDGTATIRVPYTKTHMTSAGIMKSLAPSVAAYVKRWMYLAELEPNSKQTLFCPVHRVGTATSTIKPLANKNAIAIFERAWIAVRTHRELPNKGRYETWTGHSARVGACVDMLEAGLPLQQIMLEGNWSSPDMVLLYLRKALAGQSKLTALLMSV